MNYLALDFGTKQIGVAIAISGVITTLPLIKNDSKTIVIIQNILIEYKIEKIYVGLSQGKMASKTLSFIDTIRPVIKLPIETVEESVSTIEATEIYKQNRGPKKFYKRQIDSIAAAVILNRVISLN